MVNKTNKNGSGKIRVLALQLAGFSPVALLSSSQVWPGVISTPSTSSLSLEHIGGKELSDPCWPHFLGSRFLIDVYGMI